MRKEKKKGKETLPVAGGLEAYRAGLPFFSR
jgi:hypothetical protein